MLVFALLGCRDPSGVPTTCRAEGVRLTRQFLQHHHGRYVQARKRALAYLDRLTVDPVALRQQGIKGKKKLVELLDAYVAASRRADAKERQQLLQRFQRAAAVTAPPAYHDMATVEDKQFRQDATSYLRACYLMEKMGLNARAYRTEIQKIRLRLDAHLGQRGSHQRMAFSWYYRHFGFPLPPALRDPLSASIVAHRLNPYRLTISQGYDLTHEVFVPFDYGGKLQTEQFSAADRAYLRRALEIQATVQIARRNVDLLGELLMCLRLLGDTDLAVYRDGLAFVLSSQRPSGAFGNYERLRAKRGDLLEVELYLHTTSVAMDILPLAFDGPAS